jgi:hypothetical protein
MISTCEWWQQCHQHVSLRLQGIVQWLLGGPGQRLSRQRLVKYLPEMCQHHVPQAFLREHVIMEPEPQPGTEADEPVKLITVGRRHEESTKIHELRTVREACNSILQPLVRGRRTCQRLPCSKLTVVL